jgi:predicted O-methyltransferase YrrM
MDRETLGFLERLAASGKTHDEQEPEHAERYLNLERETAEAVAMLMTIAKTRSVLEIGTSNGYSTIWIAATVGPRGGRVTSIERDPEKQAQARKNLAHVGLLPLVDLVEGNATEAVCSLAGPFDCVFFDADRVSAPQQLEILLPKLLSPALLLADNVLSHPEQIAGYLQRVDQLERTSHTILKIGKGLSVAFREIG